MRELKLDQANLKKLQGEILDVLIEFDRICRANDIKYFLSSGTLLGAIRHKGFIPWDNDADVEMLREDYEKFCRVYKSTINSELFYFQDSSSDKEYSWPYGKLRKKILYMSGPGRVRHIKILVYVSMFLF